MDDDEAVLGSLGFRKLDDAMFGKEMRMCSSNCIGCEYCLYFTIEKCNGCYYVVCFLYKPLAHDSRFAAKLMPLDMPFSRVALLSTERSNLRDAIEDCIGIGCRTIRAMDFRQISGTDLFDYSEIKGILDR